MTRALVALGSNIPPRHAHMRAALADLATLPRTRVMAVSRLHETAPVDGPPGSGPFLNAACLLDTELDPITLLGALHAVENAHGRTRDGRNAPRTLDLDLVLHGSTIATGRDLVLPHPRAHRRAFVLRPAVEIAPDMIHPLLGRTLAELLAALESPSDVLVEAGTT